MKIVLILGMISVLIVLGILGCSFITQRQVSQEDKQSLVQESVRATFVIAINEIEKNNTAEKLKVCGEVVAKTDFFLNTLSNTTQPVTASIETKLVSIIPDKYKSLMLVAIQTFHVYFDVKTFDQVLTKDQVNMLRAFANGLQLGALDIISKSAK